MALINSSDSATKEYSANHGNNHPKTLHFLPPLISLKRALQSSMHFLKAAASSSSDSTPYFSPQHFRHWNIAVAARARFATSPPRGTVPSSGTQGIAPDALGQQESLSGSFPGVFGGGVGVGAGEG